MLVKYQTNWPMIPYYYQDFLLLVKSLMRLIIKSEVVETKKRGKQFQNFDFSKKENMLGSITIGFAAESTVKELKRQDKVPVGELTHFMKECRTLVISLLEKLFARGLTGSSFLKSVGCIDPLSISTTPQENLIKDMKQVLHHLLSYNYITSTDGDRALQQYTSLLNESST